MNWLGKIWQWAILNIFVLAVMIFVVTREPVGWNTLGLIDPVLEAGKWGLRFLLVSLAITPLNRYFGWRSIIPLRKPAGLWAFGFGAVHLFLVLTHDARLGIYWLEFPLQPFIIIGLVALAILSAMAITSNRWAMKWLGKSWKRLHRLVYVASLLIVIHALLAIQMSKKMLLTENVEIELTIYLTILLVLLIARLPLVRSTAMRVIWPKRRYGLP